MQCIRHLNEGERAIIRKIADETGAVELLRTVGSIIANDHPDGHKGSEYRSRIMKIALELQTEKDGLNPDVKMIP